MRLYISGKSKVESETDISVEDFVRQVRARDLNSIDEILSQGEGNNIPILRQFMNRVIQSDLLEENDYWFLVSHLLSFDRRVYRKPITESSAAIKHISTFVCPANMFDTIVHMMLEDQDKLVDGLRFLSLFKSSVRDSHRPYIVKCAESLAQPDGFSYLYEALDLSIEERIELACSIATTPALYSLYQELSKAEEMYGIWHIQGIANFPDRLNDLPDTFETQIILDLIEKNVLHEDIEDRSGALKEIEEEGFEAFSRMSIRHKAKAAHRRRIKSIGSYVGKDVTCKMIAKYNRHYLVQTIGHFPVTGLLPIALVKERITPKGVFHCKVISLIKGQNLLLLSQKPCRKELIENIPVLAVGEEYEARFSLINTVICSEILGHGPVRAYLKTISRNFDYKIHHKVRVVSSRLATCEIEIID